MPSLGHFMGARREEWARIESLLERSEGNGLRRLSAEEMDALGRGYRRLISDVALAQRDFPNDQLTLWLNQLAMRAHLRLYRAPGGTWRRVTRFFALGFPQRFRDAWRYIAVAAVLLLIPAIGGYVAGFTSEAARVALVPVQMRELMSEGDTWFEIREELRPALAVLLFTHNIGVSFFAFSGGIWLGLGTVYTLILNGLFFGAVLGASAHYGVGHLLADFVSAHGYIELTSIVIAAAGGLMMGYAMLRPGALRRRDAAVRAARRAIALVVGSMPVFVVAGLVEGNISPRDMPTEIKLVLGPALWVGLLLWVLLVGRPGRGKVVRSVRAA